MIWADPTKIMQILVDTKTLICYNLGMLTNSMFFVNQL
jgi:hypothetical protein